MKISMPWMVVAAVALSGCAAVSEMRMVEAPPREPDCQLQFLKLGINDVTPMVGGKYELLGHVIVREPGVQDPFQERYREIVRPRACAMGGEAVTILMSSTSQFRGSGTDYAIVREARAQAESKPERF